MLVRSWVHVHVVLAHSLTERTSVESITTVIVLICTYVARLNYNLTLNFDNYFNCFRLLIFYWI